jgi:hypothetical protein
MINKTYIKKKENVIKFIIVIYQGNPEYKYIINDKKTW